MSLQAESRSCTVLPQAEAQNFGVLLRAAAAAAGQDSELRKVLVAGRDSAAAQGVVAGCCCMFCRRTRLTVAQGVVLSWVRRQGAVAVCCRRPRLRVAQHAVAGLRVRVLLQGAAVG